MRHIPSVCADQVLLKIEEVKKILKKVPRKIAVVFHLSFYIWLLLISYQYTVMMQYQLPHVSQFKLSNFVFSYILSL